MPTVHRTPLACLPVVAGLLVVVATGAGLGPTGWAVGFACAASGILLLDEALLNERRSSPDRAALGPADLVTLTRATIACGVAGMVADSFLRPVPVPVLVWLTTIALALDWVDGQVARRTGTVTARGARFDMEVDAFLILVLSVYAATAVGPWVLAIGLARYALLLAEQVLPWLRRPIPPRPWAKVVAAVQGVVLAVVAADVMPTSAATTVLVLALVLLGESFGHQVGWLWRTRAIGLPRSLRDVTPAAVGPALRMGPAAAAESVA